MTVKMQLEQYQHQAVDRLAVNDAAIFSVKVTSVRHGKIWLEDGRHAAQAFSCLVVPEGGDTVLVCNLGQEKSQTMDKEPVRKPALPTINTQAKHQQSLVVLSVLTRVDPRHQILKTEGVDSLMIQAPSIRLLASERVQTFAGKAIELVSGAGAITQQAKSITVSAACNLISIAKRCITKADHCSLDAKEILTIKGGHSLIEAENEMRLNAKHINMG